MPSLVKIKFPTSLHGSVHTKIGPVLHVKTTCCLDKYGIETQRINILGYISRDTNHYVEELRYNDPDYSSESHELANQLSTEETRASQPETRSNLMSDHYEDFIPIHF